MSAVPPDLATKSAQALPLLLVPPDSKASTALLLEAGTVHLQVWPVLVEIEAVR